MRSDYDKIAEVYNRYWPAQSHLFFRQVFDQIVAPNLEEGAHVLDLCCGTGQMCAYLLDIGCRVTGLDMSAAMIAQAENNAPEAAFVQGDASRFQLESSFDAVISFFDSMNHLLSAQELLSCFKSVRNCLKEEGYFLFDVNDYEAFKNISEGGFSKIEEESVCIMNPSFDPDDELARYHIVVFDSKNGGWQRKDAEVFEKYHSSELIINLLREAGFLTVYVLDGEEEFSLPHFAGRIFFLAQ